MKKVNEFDLMEKKNLRESVISRTEVLDVVGELLLLPSTEYATTEQVASYFSVTTRHIKELVSNNRTEIESDGYGVRKADDFISELNFPNKNVIKERGRFSVKFTDSDIIRFAPRGVALFPKRAILRIGMLLRDSEIAKEIRTRLLDIVHDTEKENPEIIHNVVEEITEEKRIMMRRVEAEMNGDYDTVSLCNAELFALKNKRIEQLEHEKKQIITNALTIIESRAVINRLVRNIAIKQYNSNFSKAFGELYTKINYKLGINIKARSKKKNESYLDTLTEQETFEVEKIVRSWTVETGLDLDSLLKIA